jgi:hypothetical protein
MNTKQEMEDRLWDYIDGGGEPAGRSEIERLLDTRAEWKQKYLELMEFHQLLDRTELEAPSMRFTKNVMEEIAKYHVAPATKTYINKNIIRGIGGVFAAMILAVLLYVFTQLHWTTGTQHDGLPDKTFGNFNLDNLNWSKLFNNTYLNIFIMINTVLGLMLLDMYLGRKKSSKEA